MNDLVFDFETRSKCDLRKCGAYVYASHPSTIVLCTGYSYRGKFYLIERDGDYSHFFELVKKCDRVVAHNYQFEKQIYENVLKSKPGWVPILANKWSCTMARALAYSLPRSLEALCSSLGLPLKKDMKGNRVMLKLSKPRKPSKNNPAEWFDGEEDFKILYDYCMRDVQVQTKLNEILYDLSTPEKKLWELDGKINERGIPIDLELVKKAQGFVERFIEEQNIQLAALTDGYVTSASQAAKLVSFFNLKGVSIPDMRASTVLEFLHNLPDGELKEILKIRKNVAKSSVKKLAAMVDRTGLNARARGGMVYHAASTGRWGGSGIQIQNLPRPVIKDEEQCLEDLAAWGYDSFKHHYPNVTDACSSILRGMVAAPEGKKFIVADFSAIEARMIFWLSRCSLGVDQFRKSKPIYEEMAARILNKPVEEVIKNERQLGKQAILGCGYGMGSAKFEMTCASYGMDVDKELADSAVKTYRETYAEVPTFWYALEDAAVRAVKFSPTTNVGNIKFAKRGDYLFCQLPSGRKLSYYQPKLEKVKTPWGKMKDQLTYMTTDSLTKKWVRTKTYGGKIAENVTQAVARDCMVNSIFAVEKAGYNIIFSVHDEIICEVDESFGNVSEFERLMEIAPVWGQDIPIKVEGYEGKRYRK